MSKIILCFKHLDVFPVVLGRIDLDANFDAFTAVLFPVEVFWVVASNSVAVGYQRFEGSCCLLPQHYTASQPSAAVSNMVL
jgi:hypothetical protein